MINEKENELFARWKPMFTGKQYDFFITDGVVDEEKWNSNPKKVVYLLDYAFGCRTWDARDYLANYSTDRRYRPMRIKRINVISSWQYGIDNMDKDNMWRESENVMDDRARQMEVLREICYVCIKKIADHEKPFEELLDRWFDEDKNRQFLIEQLSFYSPDYIICCGTAPLLAQVYGPNFKRENWDRTSDGIRYKRAFGTVYVDYCDPVISVPRSMMFYRLIDALNEIEKNK